MNNSLTTFAKRWPSYVKLAYGLIIVFALVGSCAGKREESIIVLALTSVLWVSSRIISEALMALKDIKK